MKYALISDLHSNLEALSAVFEDISMQSITKVICLGDIIGYGASPKECLDLVKQKCQWTIAGNHDHAVVGLCNKEYFNPYARSAADWTLHQLAEDDISYIKKLPFILELENFICVHANLDKPEEWGYVLDEWDANATFLKMGNSKICFIGHSHVPLIFEADQYIRYISQFQTFELKKVCRYIVNVGSVGQPRDWNPMAAYVVFDTDHQTLTLRRIAYNVEQSQRRIREAGLPDFLAERIQFGR